MSTIMTTDGNMWKVKEPALQIYKMMDFKCIKLTLLLASTVRGNGEPIIKTIEEPCYFIVKNIVNFS